MAMIALSDIDRYFIACLGARMSISTTVIETDLLKARLGGRARAPTGDRQAPRRGDLSMGLARVRDPRAGHCRRVPAVDKKAPIAGIWMQMQLLGDAVAEKSGVLFPGMDWDLDEAETCALMSVTPLTIDETILGRIVAFAEATRRLVVSRRPDRGPHALPRRHDRPGETVPARADRGRRQGAPEEERTAGGRYRPRLVQDRVSAQRRGDLSRARQFWIDRLERAGTGRRVDIASGSFRIEVADDVAPLWAAMKLADDQAIDRIKSALDRWRKLHCAVSSWALADFSGRTGQPLPSSVFGPTALRHRPHS